MNFRRATELLTAFIFSVGLLLTVGWVCWRLWSTSKPTTTIARMRELMGVLQSDNPESLEPEVLEAVLARNNRSECARDGWGRPFVIERVQPGERKFRIRSLGSDGRMGPCCRGLVDSWEDDVVLEGETWLQQWTFGHDVASSKR